MVRQVNCVEAYQWNASESRWVKVGNVVGGSNDSQTTSGHGKTHFEGKVQCILKISTCTAIHSLFESFPGIFAIYTVSQKKGDTILLSISSLNIDRFS